MPTIQHLLKIGNSEMPVRVNSVEKILDQYYGDIDMGRRGGR